MTFNGKNRQKSKRPMGLNGQLSIRDSILTSCQKGSFWPCHKIKKTQQWQRKTASSTPSNALFIYYWFTTAKLYITSVPTLLSFCPGAKEDFKRNKTIWRISHCFYVFRGNIKHSWKSTGGYRWGGGDCAGSVKLIYPIIRRVFFSWATVMGYLLWDWNILVYQYHIRKNNC